MKFETNAELKYDFLSPSTLVLNIHALRTPRQTVLEESLLVEPYVKVEELSSEHGENRLIRIEILEEKEITISYKAIVDNFFMETDYSNQPEVLVAKLDTSVLPYLYPSRYLPIRQIISFCK